MSIITKKCSYHCLEISHVTVTKVVVDLSLCTVIIAVKTTETWHHLLMKDEG